MAIFPVEVTYCGDALSGDDNVTAMWADLHMSSFARAVNTFGKIPFPNADKMYLEPAAVFRGLVLDYLYPGKAATIIRRNGNAHIWKRRDVIQALGNESSTNVLEHKIDKLADSLGELATAFQCFIDGKMHWDSTHAPDSDSDGKKE